MTGEISTMALELIDDAAGDPRNALYLALACDFAYYDEAAAAPKFLETLGLEAKLISVDNTQVYVAQGEKSIVVAFRGSQSPDSIDGLKDWLLTNANDLLILPEGRIGTDFVAAGVGARFHRGFLEALADIWDPLFAAVDAAMKAKERPLWVTGHSLGGALALLAAWRLQRSFIPVQKVYTFGSPMIGNAAAAEAFKSEFTDKIFRYVDEEDLVPLLPAFSLVANPYGHCLSEVALGAAIQAAAETSDGSALGILKALGSKVSEGLHDASLLDDLWSQAQQRLGRHMIANYHARIVEKCGGQA
jgi:triacylglycerol lipase